MQTYALNMLKNLSVLKGNTVDLSFLYVREIMTHINTEQNDLYRVGKLSTEVMVIRGEDKL